MCTLILTFCQQAGGWVSLLHAQVEVDRAQQEAFEKHVRPLLSEHCYECHSGRAKKLQAGLRVDSRDGLLRGGDSGPSIVPGDPAGSMLLQALRYESFEMPPRRRLPEEEVAHIEQWILAGAWWPEEPVDFAGLTTNQGPSTATTTESANQGFDWRERKASHWAWHRPVSPSPPPVRDLAWCRNPIDRFVLAKLEANSLQPAADADRQRLLRRVYFDLTGLPPTAIDVDAFLQDASPEAYENAVERLLASPRFGETWARHWMDLVRYADTCGHEFDYPLQHSERYRDYLVRAWNDDIGYDQLVKEHIAGDLLSQPRRNPVTGWNESLLGTGFWFLGEAVHAPTDVRGDEADRIDNQLDVFGKTFLGVTLACARCHDHKFDPIPTSDYYAMAGILQSSRRQRAMLDEHDAIAHNAAQLQCLHAVPSPALVAQFRDPQHRLDLLRQVGVSDANQDPASAVRHPGYVLRELLACDDGADTAAAKIRSLRDTILAQQAAAEASARDAVTFADFRRQDFTDWFTTGFAFGTSPTHALRLDTLTADTRVAPIGVADSGQAGRRLRGVLRSPTFEIQHGKIHYRLKCDQAQIRLIVDGYVMDTFSSLLFADCTLSNVKTDGEFRWVTQQRDLDHYQGHRAHIEILDEADGYATVEQIVFSDGPPPSDPPTPLALRWAQTLSPENDLSEHLDWWAGALTQIVNQANSHELDRDAAGHAAPASSDVSWAAANWETLNWLLKRQVITAGDAWQANVEQIRNVETQTPAPVYALAMADGTPEDERIHIRGKHRNLGPAVPRHLLVALCGDDQVSPSNESGRRRVAEQLTDPQNPLVARVIVNRLWHHLFGRGIVASVDDFGVMGVPPTHPELLDWLATDLIDHHWSLKQCIRQMVMSRTYQMASVTSDAAAVRQDPDNLLLHRASVRRITAEAMRDAILQQSGRLDCAMYGASVPVYLTPFMTGRGRPESGPLDGDGRRTLYIKIQRNFLSPTLLAFDMPSPFSTMGRRSKSNVPAQSLILMNDEFIWAEAQRWAESLIREQPDLETRIDHLFMTSCGHLPNASQRQQIRQFVAEQAAVYGTDETSLVVWTDVCHAVWNLKESIYLF